MRIPPYAIVLVFALLAAGCGPKSPQAGTGSDGNGSKKIVVAMLPKKKGVPYFTSCSQGAEEAAKALGNVQLIYDGPTDGAPEKAAAMIEKWTLQDVDIIAISPNDPEVLAPAMRNARKNGVHVITWDADAAPDTREFFVNQASAKEIGYALADTMARDLGDASGEVAIITASLTAANQNEWIKYIKEQLANYPNLTLVGVQPSNEDQKVAFQIAQDLIKAHPNLRGIFAISSVAFPGAAEAVKQSGKSGSVLVTGLAAPNDMRSYVKDGTVKSVILWNTKDLGYLVVQTAEALMKGTLKPGAGTIQAGRLGEKKVEGDQILLGGILVFTKDNIDKYQF